MVIDSPSARGEKLSVSRFGMPRSAGALISVGTLLNFSVPISHKRDDYTGALRVRARLPLPAGFEVAVDPGLMLRMMSVDNTANGNTVTADQYLYTGWLGYGPSIAGGLGWHVFGPAQLTESTDPHMLLKRERAKRVAAARAARLEREAKR